MTHPVESAPPTREVDPREVRRIAFSAFIGTALEWYDFFLFGTASALVFQHVYFSGSSPIIATMASFATFGVGFLARPLGGVLFGAMGDRWGRKPTLIVSIVAIGLATGLVGCLPTSASIGLAAPILLTCLRLLQGVAVGGEWGGATTLALEHAPPEKRGRYAALVQIGSPAGTLLSSGAFALVFLLPDASVDSWGWRLPFLAAFPFLGIALWIRLQVEESPVFQQAEREAEGGGEGEAARGSLVDLFRAHGAEVLWATCGALVGIGGFFVMSTYALSYGTSVLGIERQSMVNATVIAAVGQILINVGFGRLAEKIGAHRVVIGGGLASAILAWPLWILMDTANIVAITVAIVLGLAVVTISYSVVGVLITHMFPSRVRYMGMAISVNIAGAISGLLPFIATWMNSFFAEQSSLPAIVILVVISLVTVLGGYFGSRHRVADEVIVKEKAE